MINIIYINLKHRNDRRENIINQFGDSSGINIIRFEAIEYNPGAVGCSLSHIECLKYAKSEKMEYVIIMEDDFELLVSKDEFIDKINVILKNEFDVVLLSGFIREKFEVKGDICRIKNAQTTIGYIVKSHYYDKLIDNYKEGVELLKNNFDRYDIYALDQYWKRLQKDDKWYISKPILGKQMIGYSDIEKKDKNYDDYYLRSNFNKMLLK
jgi:glycosyl transferase family 25